MALIWPPPTRVLALAAMFALLLVVVTCLIVTRQPWLGITLVAPAGGTGLVVASVHPQSPNPRLVAGDTIVALAAGDRQEIINADTLPVGAVDLPTFAHFNRFLAHHEILWTMLVEGQFDFVLADGRRVPGQIRDRRPTADLSWNFWFMAASAVVSFLIGAAIWVFRRKEISAQILFVGAIGFLIGTLLAALVHSRELTLTPLWLRVGIGENNLGIEIITYSLVALLWYYPAPLTRFPAAAACAVFTVMIWINEKWQLVEWPLHAYVTHYLAAFAVMLVFAVLQWRRARHDALARASLQWFLLTVLLVAGGVVALFFAPIAYTGKPVLPTVITYAAGPLLFLGLAFGIARYRLFDLERWWLEVWLWLAGGLLVIGIDVLLITFFHLADLLALGFALVLAGWVYLPLRQWLFRRMLRPSRTRLDDHFPLLIETLFRDGAGKTFSERWRELVQRVFMPMTLTPLAQPITQTTLAESGLALQVPSFDGNESYELRYREQGRRLYTPRDVQLADSLLGLTRRAAGLWQQREEGARTERARIMRDLHDDVAARLLTLMHRAKEPAHYQQANDALSALREVIYALDDKPPLTLPDLMTDLEAGLRERARDHGIEVDWQGPESLPAVTPGARAQINLKRILSEAASNALRHGAPTRFTVNVWVEGRQLHLNFCNDGAKGSPGDWIAGKGLNNIRNRIQEIGGEAEWTVTDRNPGAGRSCCVGLRLPLSGLKSEP